ncbi:toxin-antitoxin system YwqK family antitoxin [Undibacterium sp. TJN25]|uniref:toxin-antitoxin system YwqK family antitoxin n=1 Tax=Undibacterium sp. TJN25 TaxID=3413056 RepID=UPI003BF2645F
MLLQSLLRLSLRFSVGGMLLYSSAALAIQVCELNQQPVDQNNGSSTAGKTGIMRCKEKESGVLMREQELRNGKFVGLVRFYKDGKLATEYMENEKGNHDGIAREFAPNGQVLREDIYVNGQQTGISKSFHQNGKLRRATFYGDDTREQAYAEFNESGLLRALRCADKPVLSPVVNDATLCGFSKSPSRLEFFNEKAELRARGTYEAGKRMRFESMGDDGKTAQLEENTADRRTEQFFSREGVKRREIVSKLGGKTPVKERQQEFSDSGTLVSDKQWVDGDLRMEKVFYLNGQLRTVSEYTTSGKQRSVGIKSYYDSGTLASEETYLRAGGYQQQATGTHKSYNQQGKLVAETSYDERGRLKHERGWDEAGKLVRDDEVFEDGSRKAYAK